MQSTPEFDTALLWTANEAAQALRISPRTLWTLTKAGTIPCVRLGRLVRYNPQELQAMINKGGGTQTN